MSSNFEAIDYELGAVAATHDEDDFYCGHAPEPWLTVHTTISCCNAPFFSDDEVYYTLGLSQRFDIFHRDAYSNSGAGQCGTPYQRSGLVVSFSQQDLQRIPYNQLIEIPITVTPGQLCNKFVNVELQIIATCEIPNSNSQ
eukprot:gene18361-18629_t